MDSTGDLPILDLSKLRGSLSERSAAVQMIGSVCQTKGFFQVINHGISTDILRDALDVAAAFFDLPADERSGLASDDLTVPVRYATASFVLDDDGDVMVLRHVLKQNSYPLEEWIDKWPAKPLQYWEKMGKYATEVRRQVSELMEAITESLGLGRHYLRSKMDNGFEMMLLNCYPPPPAGSGTGGGDIVSCAAHTDYTLLSVLLASHEGLEELDQETGSWRAAPHGAGALVVHAGDCLEALSNGRYRAAVHRVAASGGRRGGGSRVSIATLTSLAMDERVEVAEELVDARHPAMYRGSTLREYTEFLKAGRKDGGNFMDSLKINGAV
ncbi:hypothetical protein ACP70R_042437 [Stipagrostis hirtigluma subsp. patula]